jgi:hypothetical protein
MAVDMKRSTNTAPVSLSTSYLIASPCMGISMTTLQSFGRSRPAGTRSRLMARGLYRRAASGVPRRRRRIAASALFALAFLAAASGARGAEGPITPFSEATAGATVPAPWGPVKINDRKIPTRYDLVTDDGVVVLHARADKAASGLGQKVRVDLKETPWLTWRWKVDAPVSGADPSAASREDAPARIVMEFDGDKSKLGLADRAADNLSAQLSGRPLPYATLMYIFAENVPVGTVIPNPHTKRIQMIVVDNGAGVRKWNAFSRNVRDDYRKAFREEPQALVTIGVLTDADNTGTSAEAWYGDLKLSAQP